jgi:type VI secretion system VasD/TssJ family lipoprotein
MDLRIVARAALLLAISAALAGCGGTTDRIDITSSPHLNACDEGGSHAVIVRIYGLKATEKFGDAEFTALWDNDRKVLGDDLATKREQTILPGAEGVRIPVPRAESVVAIGLLANFCDLKPGCWRKTVYLDKGTTEIVVNLEGTCLAVD